MHPILRARFMACLFGAALALVAPARAEAPTVTLELRNDAGAPIRCILMLGHWVTQGLPMLAPGRSTALSMNRQPEDGALYILRADGRRRMMVETLLCGEDSRWWETRAEISLMPLRQGASRLRAACQAADRL